MSVDYRLSWLKSFLLKYYEENDSRIFYRMLKREEWKPRTLINEFFETPLENTPNWQKLTLIFYKTQYKKNFYKWIYTYKKIVKARRAATPPEPETPPTPSKKPKLKPVPKAKKGKDKKTNDKDESKASTESHSDPEAQDQDKAKRTKSFDNKSRPESPQTVVEAGPQAETEVIIQKVKALVRKKKIVNQFHCCLGPLPKGMSKKNRSILVISRKSVTPIPAFDTYFEAASEMPKYISVSTHSIPEYMTCFRKQIRVLVNHIESSLTEPELGRNELVLTSGDRSKTYIKFKNLVLPYDTFFMSASTCYHNYQQIYQNLNSEGGNNKYIDTCVFKKRLNKKEIIPKGFTLKTILSSPLYLMNEHLANIFYNIRQKKELKECAHYDRDLLCPSSTPIKTNLKNHLYELLRKLNWCLNHIESDVDIEVAPWPGIGELIALSPEDMAQKKEVVSKIEKQFQLWEKYIKTLLNKCRSKNPKGSGPAAEYQYWFKREDHLGPVVLTFYGKHVSDLLKVLSKVDSPQVKEFLEKRLELKKYYEISRDNRDYICACIQCLEVIHTAKYMDEVRIIIPEFWRNLRYLWLLSGYWAVKSNIVCFIERVQYLIVKKSIKVLEVEHFFMVPQSIGEGLALEVVETMETWKKSFEEVKSYIEMHQWETRWEFPLHRLFTVTDYIAKLARDFSYLSSSLKQYFDIFNDAFSRIVQDKNVVETFSERVKSLTVPLKTADFNIYDPDNDVHWNLLIESFTREINAIEKESLQIINQSFKSLRSSVYAIDFLLTSRAIKSQEKSHTLLMKKFEFINIQIIKEIKLLNEFIMNQISSPPILNYHSTSSGEIYWIRQLCVALQLRYQYLSSIEEMKQTRTQKRAENCFLRVMRFYELYQLTIFADWVYINKRSLHSQLSGRILKLTNISSTFNKESYECLAKRSIQFGNVMSNYRDIQALYEGIYNYINAKFGGKSKQKLLKLKDKKSGKLIVDNKNESSKDDLFITNKEMTTFTKSEGIAEDEEDSYYAWKNKILNNRQTVLFYLYNEEEYIRAMEKIRIGLGNLEKVSTVQGDNKLLISPESKQNTEGTIPLRNESEGCENVEGSISDIILNDNLNDSTGKLFHLLDIIDEVLLLHSASYFFVGGNSDIIENIERTAECIFTDYALMSEDTLKLDMLYSLNDVFVDNIAEDLRSERSSDPLALALGVRLETRSFENSPLLDRTFLIGVFQETYKPRANFQYLSKKALDYSYPYSFLQLDQEKSTFSSLYKVVNIHKIQTERKPLTEDSALPYIEDSCETYETESQFERRSKIGWDEYITGYLLLERGHLPSLNFHLMLFQVILQVYNMTKLGYRVPNQFYGLCLMHKTLLSDLQAIEKVINKYNNIILNFKNETILTLKQYICDFEYLLLKGFNYYSWHTTRVEIFFNQLQCKMKKIICLSQDERNISLLIQKNISKIKYIDWFNLKGMITEEKVSIKEFFLKLEAMRKLAFNELMRVFHLISELLKKLELLILNEYSGYNKYLVLNYKHYEEEIFKAVTLNFLLQIKHYKNLIIGKSEERIHVRLMANPYVECELNGDQCRYFFLMSLEALLSCYECVPRWNMGTCINVPWLKVEYPAKIYHQNYLEDMIKLKVVATELIDLDQFIDTVTQCIASYLSRWQQYKILWDYDKEITIDLFFKYTHEVIKNSNAIFSFFDEIISELMSCKKHVDLYCLRLDLTNVIDTILSHTFDWKNILKCKLTERARNYASKLWHRLSGVHDILIKQVKCLEDFQNVLQAMEDITDLTNDFELLTALIGKIQYTLTRHGLQFSEKDRLMQNEIKYMYGVILELSKYRELFIRPCFMIYSNISEERLDGFLAECRSFAENYYLAGPGTVGDELHRGHILLQEFRRGFDNLNQRRKRMKQAENLFDHMPRSYKMFDEAYEEFCHMETAYELYEKLKEVQSEWATIPWIYMESSELMSGINKLLQEFSQLPQFLQSLPVSQQIYLAMKQFKDSIPLMLQLKNDSLKERHWYELMSKTGYTFDLTASKFTLKDIFSMKLYHHQDTINDIIGKAVNELNIENSINHVKKFWSRQALRIVTQKKQLIIKESDSCVILLDDYCIYLQGMADSQFAVPFLDEIRLWEKKLASAQEIVISLRMLQDNLLNIQCILEDRKLLKTLPALYNIYDSADKEFLKLMKIIQFRPNILEQVDLPDISQNISGLLKSIEECKHMIYDYLMSKKSKFPRYFLLSDEELFSIVGSKDDEEIQTIVPKVFCNIMRMDITKKSTKKECVKVEGLVSAENELFIFKNPVVLHDPLPSSMDLIEEEMKSSKKYMTKMAIYSYATTFQHRSVWIYQHLSSCILAAINVWWTLKVEDTFRMMEKGDMQAMKHYINILNDELKESFSEVSKSLKASDRLKFCNVILVDIHGKEVVEKLSNNSVISSTDFAWESQLRFYWKKQTNSLVIKQCLDEFDYGYEYMGINRRLVITPLTERIYLALTQALSMHLGAVVTGPAASGKSETVKDLSQVFGIFCIFTNCSPTMTTDIFKRLFSAFSHDGIWGCFDEINLVQETVLNVIWKCIEGIKNAKMQMAETLCMDGKHLPFNRQMGIFLTMNPTFSVNEKLPSMLRLLFRPVSCILPHIEQVCYVMLLSEGFTHAKVLAKKMCKLHEMADTQLSSKGIYDFGLRSLKALLLVVGDMKRAAPDMEENVVLFRALRDTSRSKFHLEDEVIYKELLKGVFRGVDCPPITYPQIETAIKKIWTEMDFVYSEKQACKVVELYESLQLRHSAVIVGPSGGGKTLIVNTLCQVQSSSGIHTSSIKINPKAMPVVEFYGYFEKDTNNWIDGLFSKLLREMKETSDMEKKRFIILDGDIDPHWTESINSLMDDNKQLTLANSERIQFNDNSSILFETGSINNASPGFISRTNVIYVHLSDDGHVFYWKRWVTTRIDDEEVGLLNGLYEKYIPSSLGLIFGEVVDGDTQAPINTLMPVTKLGLVVQLCFMIDVLLPIVEKDIMPEYNIPNARNGSKGDSGTFDRSVHIESIFIQAIYTSLGALICDGSKIVFDKFIKKTSCFHEFHDTIEEKAKFGSLPGSYDTLFDYCADMNTGLWVPWKDLLNQYIHDRSKHLDEIIVPTQASCQITWLMHAINQFNCMEPKYKSYKYKMKVKKKAKRSFLLIGEPSSSKSTTMKEFTQSLDKEVFDSVRLGLRWETSASYIEQSLEGFLLNQTPYKMAPKSGKNLIIVIDDLNRPQADSYGTRETTAFLKLLIENGGLFWRKNNLNWSSIKDVLFYTTMTRTQCSLERNDPRLLSLFAMFSTSSPNDDIITHIYSSILQGHTEIFNESIQNIIPDIIAATKEIYKFSLKMLKPTPKKFHYNFNLRDLSRIVEGLLLSSPPFYRNPEQFIRMWRNEVTRILCDRLISQEDRSFLETQIKDTVSQYFSNYTEYVMRDPLLFGDYRNAMQPQLPRDYEDLLDHEAVYHLFTEILDELKKPCPGMNLVLFEEALDHLTRIHRVLRLYRGHILLVGPTGSGKKTLLRLSSYTAGCDVFSIRLKKDYDEFNFHQDMIELFKKAAIQNKKISFLLKSNQIINEPFLENINNFLVEGSFMEMISYSEKCALLEDYCQDISINEPLDGKKDTIWNTLEDKIRKNLHIVVLMASFDDVVRKRCRKYPGLLNNLVINWMDSWPSQALQAIARRQLKHVDNVPEMYKDPIIDIFVFIHENTSKYSTKLNNNDTSLSFITPRHYLDVILHYITMVQHKFSENHRKGEELEKGLLKLKEAGRHHTDMKKDIQLKIESVTEMKNICEAQRSETLKAMENLNRQKNLAMDKKQDIHEMNAELKQQMEEIQLILSRALGDIDKAQDSIRELDLDVIFKLCEKESPSEIVVAVFECLLILLGAPVLSWLETKKMVVDPQFLSHLEDINLNTISFQQQKQIRSRLKKVNKVKEYYDKESTEIAFLSLVEGILNYCSAVRETKPKQERISELEKELSQAQQVLEGMNSVIDDSEKNLGEHNEKELKAVAQSENEEAELKVMMNKLEAADKLLIGLEEQKIRWEQEQKSLKIGKSKIIGNCLLCASFLIYSGIFSWDHRKIIFSTWLDKIKRNKIPISKSIKIEDELTNNIQLSEWKKNLLPGCEWSVQNAILLTNSPRIPFCIDPREQALNWILSKEESNNLAVLTLETDEFLDQIKSISKLKYPILIRNIEFFDPQLFNDLKTAISDDLQSDDCSETLDQQCRLYMTTKLDAIKFDSSVFSQTTVINFEIDPEELKEILTNIVIQHENPNLWIKGQDIKNQDYLKRKEESNLQCELLIKITAADYNVLESVENINELHCLEQKLDEIHADLSKNGALYDDYLIQSGIYMEIAKCGSVLYFVINNLKFINRFYQNSLYLFQEMFIHSLRTYESHPVCEIHISDFNYHLKKLICQYVCQGMFSNHKLLVPVVMAMELQKSDGIITKSEVDFFTFGSQTKFEDEAPPFHWITKEGWNNLKSLAHDFKTDFGGVFETLSNKADEWEKWYFSADSNLPCFITGLRPFQKLMLLRCLSVECIPRALLSYIKESMGEKFVDLPFQSLSAFNEDFSPKIPIVLITEPGIDPLQRITKLAKTCGLSDVKPLVISSETKLDAQNEVSRSISVGGWIIYYNWLCCKSICEKILEILENGEDINPTFRLWLISDVNDSLPLNILQSSVKVVLETADLFKYRLASLYEEIDEDLLDSCNHPAFKPILYAISFFHCVIQERRKFQQCGWNMNYEFGFDDYSMSIEILKTHLSNAIQNKNNCIPWECLKFLMGEIIYGGHILDKYDRNLILTYLEEYFDDSMFSPNEQFKLFYDTDGRHTVLPDGSKEDYLYEIRKMPLFNTSGVIGLHRNNEISLNRMFMESIWKDIALIQNNSGAGLNLKGEDFLNEIIDTILRVIPAEFNTNIIKKTHIEKKFIQSTLAVLIHELDQFNSLIKKISSTLTDMKNGLSGKTIMDEGISEILEELSNGKLPNEWSVLSPPTSKSLTSWLEHFNKRKELYQKWSSEGKLHVIWLGGLYSPKSYLIALCQVAAEKGNLSLENLIINSEITRNSDQVYLEDPQDTSCYISGMFLQGAGWDKNNHCLSTLSSVSLLTPLPLMWVSPTEKLPSVMKKNIRIPVYETLKMNNSRASLVFEANSNSASVHNNIWILEGLCMILSNY